MWKILVFFSVSCFCQVFNSANFLHIVSEDRWQHFKVSKTDNFNTYVDSALCLVVHGDLTFQTLSQQTFYRLFGFQN